VKKTILIFAFLLSACVSIFPTPNDFPPPPSTVIVEFPNVTAVPTLALRPQPITEEKMSDARTFLLILYTRVASGDDYGIAESVKYPITVDINGPIIIATADEFVAHYNEIFNGKVMDALKNTKEEDLIYLPEGIRVGHGEIWFNLFCVDAACSDTQFLITQINH
jgi:hypothetical protein